jgi:phosphonate transport system permease protein
MAADARIAQPLPLRTRSAVLLSLALAAAWAYLALDLDLRELVPNPGGLELAGRFFVRALSPALSSEAAFVPDGAPPLLVVALDAAATTLLFAGASMSLAIVLGLGLGFLAARAWAAGDPAGATSPLVAAARRTIAPLVWGGARVLIALLRSVHEILWAILFTAAFGLSPFSALFAIALPYGGTLAKIWSELVDEAPRDAGLALRAAGASGLQVFCFGLVPRALPDMIAYSFYRFECAVRSSAVLGFFGFPTLGMYLHQSFRSASYGEVWTFLYVLLATVALFDAWSGALRRRLVG